MKFNLHTIKKSTAPNVWVLAGLLLSLSISQFGLGGFVLCYGLDGHVEVEHGHALDCAGLTTPTIQDTLAHGVAPAVLFDSTDDCYVCLDVPLVESLAFGEAMFTNLSPTARDAHLSQALTDILPAGRAATTSVYHGPVLELPPVMTMLRTVILLI